MASNSKNTVNQEKFEVYYPDWDKPDENFYSWQQKSRLIGYFDKCFAGGGYKLLHRVAGMPQVLAKYKSTKFDACATEKEVLKYSSAIRSLWQRLMPWQKELLGRVMCLPIAVCRDKQGRCSLLLPLMEDVFLSEEWQTCDVLNPKLFAEQEYKVPAKNYFAMAFELAKVFASLHNNDFIHGDISDRNIRLYPPAAKVYIIDCDNLSMGEMAMPLMTEDFVTPELTQGKTLGVTTEDYTLAIFLYSLLLHRHPLRPGRIPTKHVGANEKAEWIFGTDALYVEADDGSNYTERRLANEYRIDQSAVVDNKYRFAFPWKTPAEKVVGKRLSDMFRQTFTSGINAPNERPSAEKWADEIYKVMCRMIPCDNIFVQVVGLCRGIM
jgi:serine/threonine protein kinase